MPQDVTGQFSTECIRALDISLDIRETQKIIDLMEDTSYWQNYFDRLPQIQKHVFGDYIIEGAAKKTALLAIRALMKGSFGDDTASIMLNPEFGIIQKFKSNKKINNME